MFNVYKFNQEKCGFDLDTGNEHNMLKEELKEFFDAKTLAERVDAMIDVRYVYEGTQMKFSYAGRTLDKSISDLVGQFHRLSSTIVIQELGEQREHIMGDIMDKAWAIVCEINEEKNIGVDKNNKVKKQDDLRNATEEISDMIEEIFLANPLTN